MKRDVRKPIPEETEPEIHEHRDFLFKDTLPYLTQFIARLLQIDYLGRIAETGIAPAQAFVLGELWMTEPLSQVELARRLDIGKATVGQTLNRLERAGLIERRRLATDRRVIMIHLTEQGWALREPLKSAARAQLDMLDERIGADEVRRITDLLAKAAGQLRAAGLPGLSEE
ncbi:MAG TPA: MarR family transcriptional regulator [Sphingomonas sp.]|nr:MarR family transcriptional regulator [Sphingomonas sp.]